MLAFALSIILFIFWVMLGYGLLTLLDGTRWLLQRLLLAPTVGITATVLPIFWLNYLGGLPVSQFGPSLAIALLLVSLGLLAYLRPTIPLRQYSAFTVIFLFALLITGWPMLEFGFDWVSYSNDDMANYALISQRLLNHGYFEAPEINQWVLGRDFSLVTWFVELRARPGTNLLFAWVISVTGLSPHAAFMPSMLALHLALISAAGALVYQTHRFYPVAWLTCLLLATSALTALGTLYQLNAQVIGLTLFVTLTTLLLRPFAGMKRLAVVRYGLLVGMVGSTLFVCYPEIVPFLALAFGLYLIISFSQRHLSGRPLLIVLGTGAVSCGVILSLYLVIGLAYLGSQVAYGTSKGNVETTLFPYFLLPSGLAQLWGLQSIAGLSLEPWLSLSIALGAVLSLGAVVAVSWLCWQRRPVAFPAAVMILPVAYLFSQRSGFGLFKLAMFIQPFMLGTLTLAWFSLVRRPFWRMAPLILMALAGLYAHSHYVQRSRDLADAFGSGLTEIRNASASGINTEFQQLLSSQDTPHAVLDTAHPVLAKFQAVYLKDKFITAVFPSKNFFSNLIEPPPALLKFIQPTTFIVSKELAETIQQKYQMGHFNLYLQGAPAAFNAFEWDTYGQPPQVSSQDILLIMNTPQQSLLNRRHFSPPPSDNFAVQSWAEVNNHLISIASQLGQPYYASDISKISLYQLEPDYWYPGATIAGSGRHFLFQVINPTPSVRLVLNMTGSLKGDGENQLPPVAAIGTERQLFSIVGRGSARVFSPPISPQVIAGRNYVALDMGVDGDRFPDRRTGLMNLYGTDIPLDRRHLVGFIRDISLISEEEYTRLASPSQVADFPTDLAHPDLEYSGLYEDGWASEAAFVGLTQPHAATILSVRGTLPLIDEPAFTTELTIWVDHQEVARRALVQGEFEIQAAIPPQEGRRQVNLGFSSWQRLPEPDNRVVAAQLHFVGFETAADLTVQFNVKADIIAPSPNLILGANWYPLETYADETFRWVNNNAELIIMVTGGTQPRLSMELEPGPGLGSKPFTLYIQNERGQTMAQAHVRGREVISFPLSSLPPHEPQQFRLHLEAGGLPTPNDPRILNFRIFQIRLE